MKVTIDEAYKLFMNDRETFVAEDTLRYYRENLSRFICFCEGILSHNFYLDDLPKDIFTQYVLLLRNTKKFELHPLTNCSDDYLKNTTINTYCRAVKAFLNFCRDEELLHVPVKIPRMPKSDAEQKVPLYQAEVDQIDSHFNLKTKIGLRNYCIFHLMLDAGLRSGEVVELKMCDLLFDKNVLSVDRSKNCKSRVVLMCPKLKQMLYKYCILYRGYNDISLSSKEKVFKNIHGAEFITENTIKQFFARLKKKADVERLHPHLLRHTFATSYIMGGGNLEMLRILLGHYDYSVTKTYLHLATQYQIMRADIYHLDSIFFKTAY